MIAYKHANLYLEDSVDKQISISFDGGNITNEELFLESMEITESIFSGDQLIIGSCEASTLRFKCANIFASLKGKKVTVNEVLAGYVDDPFQFGVYKVYSDKPTADRAWREVVAYDALYDIINADVAEWYNNLKFPMTQKAFRDSFFDYFGITQESVNLVNDNMDIEKTINPSELSGKAVITAICELNGCFGHINRQGNFSYIMISENVFGLYPRDDLYPANDLYPINPSSYGIKKSSYTDCTYEDYLCEKISKLQIRQEENDIGAIVGTGDNCYVIEDNFLVYGKNTEDLLSVARNTFTVISKISRYRPFNASAVGNPCLEIGDSIRLSTKYEIVESYILQRTLKGIQLLKDNYMAAGEKFYTKKLNSTQKSIVQLKGKTNKIERNVEETRLEIKDVESGLSSQITQNAKSISVEVKRATEAEAKLSASIEINEDLIQTKVTKGEISSQISQEADAISIKANRFSWESTNSSLTPDGTLKAQNARVTGEIHATSGDFDTVTIKDSCTVAGESISGGIGNTGKMVSWNGDTIGSNKLDGMLSSKKFSGCYIPSGGNLGFGGSRIDSGENIVLHSVSAISMRTSNGQNTVFSALGDTVAIRNLTVSGSKSRIIKTDNCGVVCLDAYETPTPMFGDIGEGVIGKDGVIYIWIDDTFFQCIDTSYQYKVFLTAYGSGELYVDVIEKDYFIIKGKPDLKFSWEIKALQKDMNGIRFRQSDIIQIEIGNGINYEYETDLILNEAEQEVENYV